MLYEAYCDGAARGQGRNGSTVGEGAAAVVIYGNGNRREPLGQIARLLGQVTNNEAEYEAVLLAVVVCMAGGLTDPIIYSDSEHVVNAINGSWTTANPRLLPLLLSIRDLQEVFRFRVLHVPRHHVSVADHMANAMLDRLAAELPQLLVGRGENQPES